MKIYGIFLNNEVRTGGHKRYLELMQGLAERGHDVRVVMNSYLNKAGFGFLHLSVDCKYREGSRPLNGVRFLHAIKRAIKQYKDELQGPDGFIVVFGESHWAAAKKLSTAMGIPIIFAMRSDSIAEKHIYLQTEKINLLKRLVFNLALLRDSIRERDIANKSSSIVFQSAFDLEAFALRNTGTTEKCRIIRGDIRQPRFKKEYALVNGSVSCNRLLFVGTLGLRKGLHYLIDAMGIARDAGCTSITLDILASGADFSPFLQKIHRLGLSAAVRFHGKVDDPLHFMRECDLLIVPSLFDSYPNTILEALHVGLPVIGSRVGGIPDMLGKDEILFKPASADEIAKKIIVLHNDVEQYMATWIYCAERRSYFDFDWFSKWESILSELTISCRQ